MKGHFVILANMNTKTRQGWLGPGAWYKPHYRQQKVSWNFYGLWIWSFNVSGKVMVEIASVFWPVLGMSQCCQFLWNGFNSLVSHFRGRGDNVAVSGAITMQYYTSYLCLLQLTSITRSKVWLSLLITQWQITSVRFHGSKAAFRWHNLHKGDVLLLEISREGAWPVLALVQAVFAGLSWWPPPHPWMMGSWGRCGWDMNFWSLWKVCACVTLVSKPAAGDDFYNQLWHVRKMDSSNSRPVIVLIGE